MTWTELLKNRRATLVAALTLFTLIASLFSYSRFLLWVELRQGFAFIDPIHRLFAPVDLSWLVYTILYGAVILLFSTIGRDPERLFTLMRAYTILVAIRMICMAMLPLDPPAAMIPLVDPAVQLVMGNGSAPLSRDLFFSGHTSFLLLVGFFAPNRALKIIFFSMTLIVGVAVILQHVHYTVDVIVAPMAAWFASSLTRTKA